jgi:predicted esterase
MNSMEPAMQEKRRKPLIALFALLLAALPARLLAQAPADPPAATADADHLPARLDTWASFPKPPADLPFLPLDHSWPDRWGRLDKTIKGAIVDIDDPKVRLESTRGFMPYAAEDSPDAEALKKANVSGLKAPEKFLFENLGSFMYFPVRPKEGEKPQRRTNEPSMRFRFVSGQLELSKNGAEIQEAVRLERTWFSVFDPVPAQDGDAKPRGTVLLMPGLFATPEGTLDKLTSALRKRGWVVLRMMAQPSRFTERADFELNAGGDLEAQAKRIAELFGDRAAECAYAAQGALAHLEDKRPELKSLPRVAIGFSGGAMTLPVVVAREPDRYAASILVGGGADFWLMNQRSNYKNLIDAVHERWDGVPPTIQDRAKLDQLYLKNAPLDSYHTAAALKGKPVLLIQGTTDLAVPSPLGDLLWERLGKPERWLQDGQGHEVLFMLLPQQFDKMMDWLDRGTGLPPGAGNP